jgi:hypothetical protein
MMIAAQGHRPLDRGLGSSGQEVDGLRSYGEHHLAVVRINWPHSA